MRLSGIIEVQSKRNAISCGSLRHFNREKIKTNQCCCLPIKEHGKICFNQAGFREEKERQDTIAINTVKMENELSKHLAEVLHSAEGYSSEECNGGAVIELLFDLQLMKIETLDDFKKRQSEAAVQELIQEYLSR